MSEATIFSKPRIVTEADLVEVLTPYIIGFPWALDTIGDLWRMGAPDPSPRYPGAPERRVLLPGAFARWWAEVCDRAGVSVTPEVIAQSLQKPRVLVPRRGRRRP